MAYAGSGSDDIHVTMRADRQQQSPAADNSTVVSESNGSETDSDQEVIKLEMQLTWAERDHANTKLDVQRLESQIDAVKALAQGLERENNMMTTALTEVETARAQIQALENKVVQLTNEKEELVEQRTASDENMRIYSTKLSTMEAELKGVREKLTVAEESRDWHREEHTQMLGVRNTINAGRAPEIDRLKSEVTKLRKDVNDKKTQVPALKRNIAFYVTHLDLANKDSRVYTCCHDNFNNIVNDGQNVTCQKNAGSMADEFFEDWENDKGFLVEYNYARQQILDHHRAHESMKRGRGDGSGWIRDELNEVDRRRRVNVTYR